MTKSVEQYGPISLGVIVGFLYYKYGYLIHHEDSIELIKQFTTIGTCSFGFLLTMFSLMIQSNSDVIKDMRKRQIPYNRFIKYNRNIVFLSFILTIYSYIIGYINILKIFTSHIIIDLLISIFYATFTCFIIYTIYFLVLFYILIQDKNDTKQ